MSSSSSTSDHASCSDDALDQIRKQMVHEYKTDNSNVIEKLCQGVLGDPKPKTVNFKSKTVLDHQIRPELIADN